MATFAHWEPGTKSKIRWHATQHECSTKSKGPNCKNRTQQIKNNSTKIENGTAKVT